MVDFFVGQKFAAKMLLHCQAMFHDLASALDLNLLVAILADVTLAIPTTLITMLTVTSSLGITKTTPPSVMASAKPTSVSPIATVANGAQLPNSPTSKRDISSHIAVLLQARVVPWAIPTSAGNTITDIY